MSDQDNYVPVWVPFIVIVILVMCIATPIGMSYNSIVASDIKVSQMKSNIQVSLERRADAIPNLVATVQGSANFEKATLVDVIAMRSQATQIKEQVTNAQSIEDLQKSENSLGLVVSRLLMLNEQYPQLQTTQSFRDLQATLLDTENEISDQRESYNMASTEYQSNVRSFPSNIVANIFGYKDDKWATFNIESNKAKVPVVSFNSS